MSETSCVESTKTARKPGAVETCYIGKALYLRPLGNRKANKAGPRPRMPKQAVGYLKPRKPSIVLPMESSLSWHCYEDSALLPTSLQYNRFQETGASELL